MKILLINGSPKKANSNTMRLAHAFLDGVKQCFDAQKVSYFVREFNVYDMNISPCKGCFTCWRVTQGQCCINDDVNVVIESELWADIILWCFPLYYYNVPGTLKILIDRQLPMVLPFMTDNTSATGSGSHPARYDITAKRFVLISTCGFYSAENNYDSVLSMFDHIYSKSNYESVFCGQGELFRIPNLDSRTNKYLEIVQRAGLEFADGKISDKTKGQLKEYYYILRRFLKLWQMQVGELTHFRVEV